MQVTNAQATAGSTHHIGKPNSLASLVVAHSGKALVAEIRGVDFSQPVPYEVKDVHARCMGGSSLMFRDQDSTDYLFMDAVSIFWRPQKSAARKTLTNNGY